MNLAPYIDHTLLKSTATPADIAQLCKEAQTHGFYAVCVNPIYVPQASTLLKGSGVRVATVCGFPLGALSSAQKAAEALESIRMGADEIDMVISLGMAKVGDWLAVIEDIRQVRHATQGQILKVIIETCDLDDSQKIEATRAVLAGGADFVKTSTGFSQSGATVKDVQLLKSIVSERIQIKAAGGVRTREDALKMIEAGASRLGTSAGVALVSGLEASGGY